MKKLILLILSIFVLGQSFVMADLIPMFENKEQEIEWRKNRDIEFEQEKRSCENRFGNYERKYSEYQCNYKNLIIFLICLTTLGGTFLYLRNRKPHSDDKSIS